MTPEKYAFLKSIKDGTIIRMNGSLRIVRRVIWITHEKKRGRPKCYTYDKGYFYFVILHCSWTRRPYTLYTSTDMCSKVIEIIGHNYKSKMPIFDAALEIELDRGGLTPTNRLQLTCCDVQGIR